MTNLDSAIHALALAADQTPGSFIDTDLGRAVVAVIDAHNEQINAPIPIPIPTPDRTAIAAQMLAALIAADLERRNTSTDHIKSAIAFADALLRELAAPVANTAPDREPDDARADRQTLLDSIGIKTLRYRQAASVGHAEDVARAVVALADYDDANAHNVPIDAR
jgi:hypothetical protein